MESKAGQQQASHFRHVLEDAAPAAPRTADFQAKVSRTSSAWGDVVVKRSTSVKGRGSVISGQSSENLDDVTMQKSTSLKRSLSVLSGQADVAVTKSISLKRSPSLISGQSSETLVRMTSIRNVEILKGIPLCLAMGSFGRLFGVGGDPVEHMAMSRPTVKLEDFISHNWAIPRYTKWAVLVLHYNFKPACLAVLAACALASLLVWQGLLPMSLIGAKGYTDQDGQGSRGLVHVNVFVGLLAFYVVLIFWHDIKRKLPSSMQVKERMTFVDKSCIHQTDRAKMIEGISSLAGFLRCSDNMVVCCGPQYFRKLWTVYEIASFLSIHRDPSRVKIYPTAWAKELGILAVVATSCTLARVVLTWAAGESGVLAAGIAAIVWGVQNLVVSLAFTYCLRRTVMINEQMKKDLGAFDIRNAHCAVESDRPIVEGNVSAFMREMGRVPEHVQQEEALDAFNHMVHTDFLSHIADARTSLTFMLRYQVVTLLPVFLFGLDQILERVLFHDHIHVAAVAVAYVEPTYIAVLGGNIAMPFLTRKLSLTSWRKHLYLVAVTFLLSVFVWIYGQVRDLLTNPAYDVSNDIGVRWLSVIQGVLFHAFCAGLTVWTSVRPCCRKHDEVQLAEVRPGFSVSV